jgi:hypothetical protein
MGVVILALTAILIYNSVPMFIHVPHSHYVFFNAVLQWHVVTFKFHQIHPSFSSLTCLACLQLALEDL